VGWKIASLGWFIVSVLLIGGLGFIIVDQAVSAAYLSQGVDEMTADLETLAAVFPRGTPKADVLAALRAHDPDAFIVETPCAVQVDGLRFDVGPEGLRAVSVRALYEEAPPCDE